MEEVEAEFTGVMPTRAGDLTVETRGIAPIPVDNRYGSLYQVFTVWFAPNMVPPAFFVGSLAAASFLKLGFASGLLAIIIGNLLGSSVVGLLATMGPRTGMAQIALARLAFGRLTVVPAWINWLNMIAWDAFDGIFGAAAFTLLTGVPFWVGVVAVFGLQVIIAIIGYEAIHTYQKYISFALAAMFVVITVKVIGLADFSTLDGFTGANRTGAVILFTTVVASFVLAWGVYAADYTRYFPPDTSGPKIFFATVGGLTLSAGWLEFLGLSVAGIVTGNSVATIRYDILSGGVLGTLAMIAIFLGAVSVNVMNDYTGSLSLQAAGLRIPRVAGAVIVTVVAFGLTLYLNSANLAQNFVNYLLVISYWVAPFCGVVLADWWLRGRRVDPATLVRALQLSGGTAGLVAFLLGAAASVPFMSTSLYVGPLASRVLHFGDIAYYVGFLVASIAYAALRSRAMKPSVAARAS